MKIGQFIAGKKVKRLQYYSFEPNCINHIWQIDDNEILNLLAEANYALGELNAYSQFIPNVDFFIKMHIKKEANTSSGIEGTQTHIEDLLHKEENVKPEKHSDWIEVHNYINAMNNAIKELKKLPLSNRLIKNTHKVLMKGARGENKAPGNYRTSQNWIGGATLKDAVFIPCAQENVLDLMSDLELFLNNDDIKLPDLIKIAIAHYQFETIHPFLDGNGRIGRLLITLFFIHQNKLNKPTLYLSSFFEKHKALYYQNLMAVRTLNNLSQWLKFFLVGVKQTAENSISTFKAIIKLQEKTSLLVAKKSENTKKALAYLFQQPIVDYGDITQYLQVNKTTAIRLIADLENLKIVTELTGFNRNRIYAFKPYIDIFNQY